MFNSLIYEIGQLAIPTDHVDAEVLARPAGWDIAFVRRFMLVFGPVSSVFDITTFVVMIQVLHAGQHEFRTGWFVESIVTRTLVVFLIRTRRIPFFRSRPSPAMVMIPIVAAAAGIAIAFKDSAPIAGDLVAFVGIALHQRTRSSSPEGWAATINGAILDGVGLQLARRNRDFLLGEQASVAARDRIRATTAGFHRATAMGELLVTFIGPRRVWVLCRVGIDGNLRGDQVESLVSDLENSLRTQSDYVQRVDIVPSGCPASTPSGRLTAP